MGLPTALRGQDRKGVFIKGRRRRTGVWLGCGAGRPARRSVNDRVEYRDRFTDAIEFHLVNFRAKSDFIEQGDGQASTKMFAKLLETGN